MTKIHTLPPELVSRIAAGEVIERPAYALKELLENALDAGATQVDIELEESGLQRMAVHDNGEGMSRDDLEQCFLPHTTSKISSAEEFERIQTLGFRGEALHSIAAISHLRIQSRAADAVAGHEVIIEKGKLVESRKIGMPEGTSVSIEDLFIHTPVRKKFLKSGQTELRILMDVFMQIALAWPGVGFRLQHNGKLLADVPRGQELPERVAALVVKFSH